MKRLLISFAALVIPTTSFAADSYLAGNISNITSGPTGLYLMLDSGVPDNCTGTPYGWMVISEDHKTMISVALMHIASGKKRVTVYTSGNVIAGGYCQINQFDPHDE